MEVMVCVAAVREFTLSAAGTISWTPGAKSLSNV
jgi:hypothetical protein